MTNPGLRRHCLTVEQVIRFAATRRGESRDQIERWSTAGLLHDAAYEATLAAAVIHSVRTGSRGIYLTLLGGGVFGNRDAWIMAAIERAFRKHPRHGLDVRIVSYSRSQPVVAKLVTQLNRI